MLKDCPFCGGKAVMHEEKLAGIKFFSIVCNRCKVRTGSFEDKQRNITEWNKRSDVVSENKDGLLSCPFCGGNAEVVESKRNNNFYVMCEKCYLISRSSDSEQEAIKIWNKRT